MSITVNTFTLKLLYTVALAGALFVALPVHASGDKARITAETDVKPLVTLSAQEAQAMSLAAGRILLHTDAARLSIALEDKKKALDEINQGLTLVKVVENALPKYKVTTKITTGDVIYTDEDEVSRRFVSVFNEQYIEDVIAPVVQAKSKHAKANDKKSSGVPPIMDYSVWRKSTMKLDVVVAADALFLAKDELEKNHFDNASIALAILQTEGVIFEFDEIELPLTEAADNLKLAQLEVSEGKTEQAQATLKRASDSLKKYQSIAGESRAKDVHELSQNIDKLATSLTKGNHSRAILKKTEKEIASYWQRVVKWFK